MKCYTFEGKTLTEKELYDNIREKLQKDPEFKNLKYTIFNIQEDQEALISKAHSKYNNPQSIGTSDFIDLEHELVSESGHRSRRHLSPAYDVESRVANSIAKLLQRPDINSEQEAREEVLKQMAEEDGISDFGTLMHGLFSVAVKSRISNGVSGVNSVEFAEELSKVKDQILNKGEYTDSTGKHHAALMEVLTGKTPGGIDITLIMDTIKNVCSEVENQIFAGRDPRTIYKSEYEIATDQLIGNIVDKNGNPVKNLRGVIDLLIINPDGEVEIIDFKVSSRAYLDWYAAKQYHTDYQLATYRQILAANGVDGKKITLKTFPIHFPLGKVNLMNAETIQDRTLPNVSTPSKHLDWNSGDFTKNLKQLISTLIVPLDYENITLDDDIKEDIKTLLGEYQIPGNTVDDKVKEDIIKSIWASQINGETYYNVYDRVTGEKVRRKTRDEIIQYIDAMIPRMQSFYSDQIKALVREIKQYQNTNDGSKNTFELLNSSSNKDVNVFNVLNGCFGKYCNQNWQLVEFPELLDFGIFLFQNKQTGLFEIVRVSDKNLRTELNICGGSTVLSKFITNDQAKHMVTVKPLSASVANVQFIETMIAVNKIASSLTNGKLAGINIINPTLGQREIGDLDILKKNFKFLTSKGNIENLIEKYIRTADTWEIMEDAISSIIANPTIDNDLRQTVSGLETDTYNVQEKIKLIETCMQKLEDRYSQLKRNDITKKQTFETPQEKIYLVLSMALLYYKETPIRYDGKISQWGLHVEEIIRILGTPFLSQYKGTLNNGFKAIGFLQGLDMSTPTSIPSKNLSALYQFWTTSFTHVRKFTLDQSTYINNITTKYYQRHGVSNVSRALLNSSSIWENFIEKGPDGKFTKELKIIDPETSNLNDEDKLFLNQMLWEIQKFIIPGITEEQRHWRFETHKNQILALPAVINAIADGRYYQLPLRRAAAFDRLRHIRDNGGIFQSLKKYWDSLSDDYDPRQLHTSAQNIIRDDFGEITEMYNQYKISNRARAQIIEKEGQFDFEYDLNLLAIDVAFQSKRKELFDKALTHAAAMATVFHYLNETSDANFDAELQNLQDEIKVIMKNESPISKELTDASKGIGVAKRINSLIVLGVRPFQFIKEITYGQFTNYSRAWALKGTGQEISATSIFKANNFVWGQQIVGWLQSAIKDKDLASFTMVQMLNKIYGIANEDLNTISKNNSLSRTGIKHGVSKYMYIFSSCPDFFNRMTLFIAKMIEDDCLEAHHLDDQGNLVYDIKKDKRFDKLVQLGINSNSKDQEYLKQRALYKAIVNQFIKEGFTKEDGTQLDPNSEELYLPRAYTGKETLALKEVSDQAYGYYDHEAKSLNDHKFFGLVFKQFMAFWTAKTQLWLRAPGNPTARGKWTQLMEDGKPVFRKVIENPETGELTEEYTTENPNGDLEPVMIWEGEYTEGLIYSIGFALRDIATGKWSELVGNPQRVGNLKLALHDILIGLIMYNILRLIFSGGSGKMKDINPIERTLLRAMQDTGPQSIFGLSITPSFVSTYEQLKQDLPNLFSEDPDVAYFIQRRFGALKDITWQQH